MEARRSGRVMKDVGQAADHLPFIVHPSSSLPDRTCDPVCTSPPRIVFYDAADGRRLAVRVWEAHGSPRARAVFLHGISSHGGWYTRSSAHLAGAGVEVHFLDRRGSGLNAKGSGDVDRWQTWVDDVAAYLAPLGKARPVVLCGISWGGKQAAAVARRHPGLVAALGLICPGIYSPHEPGLAKRLALAAPVPGRVERRRLKIPLGRPELFTDTAESWRLTRYARQAASFIHMPLLVMLAGRDRIVDNCRSRAFFARTAAVKRTLVEYPNAGHTLEFEPDPTPYFSDLADWIARAD
jgi:alpha-beta hydrolase superfamily lysophospholipase